MTPRRSSATVRRLAILLALAGLNATAQAPTGSGSIRITVLDAITHGPIAKANVSLMVFGTEPGRSVSQRVASTDGNGSVLLDGLAPDLYVVAASHRNYPTGAGGRSKGTAVAANETAEVTLTLNPGGSISGRVLDEDGDSVEGCTVEAVSTGSLPYTLSAPADSGGNYKISKIPTGRYLLFAHCTSPIFEPRPLSSGADPPPTTAWPVVYYPAALNESGAQLIDLSAGSERSGVDFRMSPRHVNHLHVNLVGVEPDEADHVSCTLAPVDQSPAMRFVWRSFIACGQGADIPNIFPGSYALRVDSVRDRGAFANVTVGDEPFALTVELHDAVVIHGRLEMEDGDPNPENAEVFIETPFLRSSGERIAPEPDGTFTFDVLSPVRVRLSGGSGLYIKSMSIGGRDLPDGQFDPNTGSGELRLILSRNTATIRGTAPPGTSVLLMNPDHQTVPYPVDASGHFRITALAPGSYQIGLADSFPFSQNGTQTITLSEGETLNLDLKPADDSATQ